MNGPLEEGKAHFHAAGDPYDPFVVRGRAVVTRPIESALVALNQWLPVGATFRSVPRVRGLIATAIGEPVGGAPGTAATPVPKLVLILDNEGEQAQPLVIHASGAVRVSVLSAAFPGLATFTRAPTHGLVRTSVARHSILAVSPAS